MQEIITIRPELLSLTEAHIAALAPHLWILGGAIAAIITAILGWKKSKWPMVIVSSLALIGAAWSSGSALGADTVLLFNNMLVADRFSAFFNILFLLAALATVLVSVPYLDREAIQHPEYYILILFSVSGMMIMASSLDLIVLFIALELMSLCVYTLVAFRRADRRCNEAAMKYFVLGGVASAILLYGVALLYGVSGSTNIKDILLFSQGQLTSAPTLYILGVWLVIAGFLFKVASVPFHMWMPDVYEGAPVPITGFMTTALKAAAFAAFVRVFVSMGYGKGVMALVQGALHDLLWVCAVLTMVVANVIALTQQNLKRMLAYSSIAHTGYLLVGILAGAKTEQGFTPLVVYLVSYAIMNLGAFVVLTLLCQKSDTGLNLHDLSGAARRHPFLAFAMAVFLFSMAGIPPTAGFVAKFMLFYSAVQGGETTLVVISVLCSAISVYYYLRVLVFMYMREPVGQLGQRQVSRLSVAALAAMVFLTLQVGVMPTRWVEAAKRAVSSL